MGECGGGVGESAWSECMTRMRRRECDGERARTSVRRKMDPLSAIPDEASLQVLSYLSPVQLCACMRVSTRWRALCNDAYVRVHSRVGLEVGLRFRSCAY